MNAPAYDRFTRWITQVNANRRGKTLDAPSFAITLSLDRGRETVDIGEGLTEYLNEFDENAAGHWEVFDDEALETIARLDGVKSLPSWLSSPSDITPTSDLKALLDGIARLGTVVLLENQAYLTTQTIPRVFHVRLTHHDTMVRKEDTRSFHLLLNRTRFGPDSLVSIIGDSALEWASRGHDPLDRVVSFKR